MLGIVQEALSQWRKWWADDSSHPVTVEARLNNKFIICFPLAAHAINHVETALRTRDRFPWVAKSSARIAFEHALTAQWILLTADGEVSVKAGMDYSDYV